MSYLSFCPPLSECLELCSQVIGSSNSHQKFLPAQLQHTNCYGTPMKVTLLNMWYVPVVILFMNTMTVSLFNVDKRNPKFVHMWPTPTIHDIQKGKVVELLKKVRSGRSNKLIPIKVYPYQPLQKSLTYLIQKEGFLDACEKWRRRMSLIPNAHLADVYDGRVWSDFQSSGFLEAPFCYLLTLNVDWFHFYSY